MVEILADIIQNPLFDEEEIAMAKQQILFQHEDMAFEAMGLTHEFLHEAAYGARSALGHPVLCRPDELDSINAPELRQFVEEQYTPDNTVIAGVGVSHERFVNAVAKNFNAMPV